MYYSWKYIPKDEAKRIISTAKMISNGTYSDSYKYVLPYIPKSLSAESIYLPELNYSSLPNFWQYVKKYKFSIQDPPPSKISSSIEQLLDQANIGYISPRIINRKKSAWEEKAVIVEDFIYKIFRRNAIPNKIIFLPTSFGSITSSYILDNTIYIYVRYDAAVEDILKELLLAIVKSLSDKNHRTSRCSVEPKDMAEFFLIYTRLNEVFPDALKTQKQSTSVKLRNDSERFLKKLGFNYSNSFVIEHDRIIHQNSGKVIQNLTPNEKLLFTLLSDNIERVVTYEEIGDAFYKNNFDEKFSLYYISRVISDIRRKLRESGVNAHIIHTKRGLGYMMSA